MHTPPSIRISTAAVRPFRAFRTPVRGHVYAPRPPGAEDPTPDVPIRLVREPDNPADPYAVAVWAPERRGPWRLGYLDRSVAAWLASRLDSGLIVEGRLDGWVPEPDGRWRRPLLLIGSAARSTEGYRSRANIDPPPRPPGVRRRVVR